LLLLLLLVGTWLLLLLLLLLACCLLLLLLVLVLGCCWVLDDCGWITLSYWTLLLDHSTYTLVGASVLRLLRASCQATQLVVLPPARHLHGTRMAAAAAAAAAGLTSTTAAMAASTPPDLKFDCFVFDLAFHPTQDRLAVALVDGSLDVYVPVLLRLVTIGAL